MGTTTRAMLTFDVLLRRYRLSANLSQEALAERAQISAAAIAALERGRRVAPRPATVTLLADALELSSADRALFVEAAVAMREQPASPASLPGDVSARPASSAPASSAPASSAPASTGPVSTLPVPLTALIGREREESALTNLLREDGHARLITLTGPGGVGKTRLALAVAAAVGDAYPDGVIFVDLAPLSDPGLVAPTIAQALGLREAGTQRPYDLLVAYLYSKEMLLVLDNIERVVAAAPLLADLIAACGQLTILATSRIALRLRAEQRFRVPPLTTPTMHQTTEHDISRSAAVQLFVERAQAVQPAFVLHTGNTAAVAEICRRLDGLPLALELVAARINLLPPSALLGRLEQQLGLLIGGARDLPERQKTMRAAIDWSYALLSDWEQTLLRCLSVFVGGATLTAVEAAVNLNQATDDDVTTGIEVLVDHSLLQSMGAPDGEPRVRMLETIRAYGLEQLVARGEEEGVRQAHAAYFLKLVEEASAQLFGSDQLRWLEMLDREYDNLRATLAYVTRRGDIEQSSRVIGALWRYWYIRCYLSEARGWLQTCARLLDESTIAPAGRVEILVGLAVIAYAQTDFDEAATAAEQSAALTRASNDQPNRVISLNILGGVARYRCDFERAAALGEECVSLTRAMGDRWSLALSLSNLADVVRFQGKLEQAAALCQESLTLAQDMGDRWGIAQALLVLGMIARDRGDIDEAGSLFEESLAIVRALNHTRDIALALAGMGDISLYRGELDRAATLCAESLAHLQPLGDKIRTANVLTILGRVRHAQSDVEAATKLYAECLTLFQNVNHPLGIAECLEGLALMASAVGNRPDSPQLDWAVQLLAAAGHIRITIGAPRAPVECPAYDNAVTRLRALLGDERFAQGMAVGQQLSWESAVSLAIRPADDSG